MRLGKDRAYREEPDSRVCKKKDRNVILAAPTRHVIKEIAKRLESTALGYKIIVIHSGDENVDSGKSVTSRLIDAVTRPYDGPHAIIITHKALLDRPRLSNFSGYDLIIDETFQAHSCHSAGDSLTSFLITDHVELVDVGPRYGRLQVVNPAGLRKIAKRRTKTETVKGLRGLAHDLLHPDVDVFVEAHAYQSLLIGGEKARLVAHGLLRPRCLDGFRAVSILGATFEHTGLYRLWKNQGVEFVPAPELESKLRYSVHPNTENITIEYGFENNYSKCFRDQYHKSVWYAMTDYISDNWKHEPFVWLGNKDTDNIDPFRGLDTSRLPNIPHGLNEYLNYNRVACLAALNAPEAHVAFLGVHGMTREDVSADTYLTASYQAACRISIRDPSNTDPKTIFVPDERSARWLRQHCFPDATLRYLGFDKLDGCQKEKVGRKQKYATNADKTRVCRTNSNQRVDRIIYEVLDLSRKAVGIASIDHTNDDKDVCNETLLEVYEITDFSRFYGTLWRDKNSRHSLGVVDNVSNDEFIRFLKALSTRSVGRKADSMLICPSYFIRKEGVETIRGIENVVLANGIWLDFEEGTLTHKEFSNIFPALRIAAFNTWSNTKDGNRWRAYIPVSRPVTGEVYYMITGQIRVTLKRLGYAAKASQRVSADQPVSGLDTSKLNPASLFYLPSKANDPHSKASFFKDYRKGRGPLDVLLWIDQCARLDSGDAAKASTLPDFDGAVVETAVAEAISEWRSEGVKPGGTDTGIYRLYWALYRAGMRGFDLQQTMDAEARLANTPKDAFKKVARLVKRLR